MRFACQSCGKAYNLPEEKIADKSNVKLKCRVCGAIVEVKKQGEVVAALLGDGENKRGRVSEAPAPLTSMMPDDSDDATHAIAVSDQILSEGASGEDAASALLGHVKSALAERGLGPLPPPSPTGFGSLPGAGFGAPSSPFGAPSPGLGSGASPASFGQGTPPDFAPTPVPPPLTVPDLPRADPLPPFARPDAPPAPPLPSAFGLSSAGSPPPPLPPQGAELGSHPASLQNGGGFQSGSNGAVPRFGEGLSEEPLPPPMAPLAMPAGGVAALAPPLSAPAGDMGYPGPAPAEMPAPVSGDDTTRKMLAALATGILIGFIIARLFF